MKKFFAVIIALVLATAMSVSALAATVSENNGSQNIDVNAKYTENVNSPEVISVNIAWDSMEFTYSVAGTNNWDATNHTYTPNTNASWSNTDNTITVTNHSNTAVKAGFAFNALSAYSSVDGSFDTSEVSLPSAVGKTTDDATLKKTVKLTLDGTLGSEVTTSTNIGTVTVTISK